MRAHALKRFPFLDYAVSNVLHHAERASEHEAPQHDFVQDFPLSMWRSLNNLVERHTIRRYTDSVTKTYAFAEKGTHHLLKVLIDQGGADFSRGRERFSTALEAAIHNKDPGTVTLLAEHGAMNFCSDDEMKRLLKFGVERRASRILQAFKGFRNRVVQEDLSEVLLDSYLLAGNAIAVQFLIEHEMITDPYGKRRDRELVNACYKHQVDLIWLFINLGADVNAECSSLHTRMAPLWAACYNLSPTSPKYPQMLEVIGALLAKGAKVDAWTGQDMTALGMVCQHGCAEAADILIRNGADVNIRGYKYRWGNALCTACCYGSEDIVKALLDAGADVNARHDYFGTALETARQRERQHIVKLLFDYGAEDDQEIYVTTVEKGCKNAVT